MAQRSLLSGADDQGCIAPDQLLKSMVKAFEAARDGVTAVDAAWRKLGESLGLAAKELTWLRANPANLEDPEARELEGAEHALALRRAQVQSDPLGTSLDIETVIRPVIDRVKAAVEERGRLRTQTENGFSAARARLKVLGDLHREASAAWEEAREKVTIAGELLPPISEERLQSLREWLDRLQRKYDGGMLRPVTVGLRNWNSAADTCVSDIQKVNSVNSAPLELRKELRGRMNALKAKAQAYRVEEDANLTELAREAEALLYTRPTPMDRAVEVVTRYQTLLNERTARPRRG